MICRCIRAVLQCTLYSLRRLWLGSSNYLYPHFVNECRDTYARENGPQIQPYFYSMGQHWHRLLFSDNTYPHVSIQCCWLGISTPAF